MGPSFFRNINNTLDPSQKIVGDGIRLSATCLNEIPKIH